MARLVRAIGFCMVPAGLDTRCRAVTMELDKGQSARTAAQAGKYRRIEGQTQHFGSAWPRRNLCNVAPAQHIQAPSRVSVAVVWLSATRIVVIAGVLAMKVRATFLTTTAPFLA